MVTTPLFMSGSDQEIAEFRIPSFLGVLRFWYRATAPGFMVRDVTKLRDAEACLFGSSDTKVGQAAFLTRVDQSKITLSDGENIKFLRRMGVGYLGYGLSYKEHIRKNTEKKPVTNRGCINANSVVKVKFILKQRQSADIDGLVRAIKALGLFGGCGSRSRRGFGSLTLLSLKDLSGEEIWERPSSREQLQTTIQDFLDDLHTNGILEVRPSYTAFSSESRIVLTRPNNDPLSLLNEIGEDLIRYRSYGQKDDNSGEHLLNVGNGKEKARQLFADDHDLVLSVLQRKSPERLPRRIAFGLPHNYYFKSIREGAGITGRRYTRRGSPLLIHIHALDNQCVGVLTYLPGQFLPEGEQIVIKPRDMKGVSVPVDFDSKVIPGFLDKIPDGLEVTPR